MNKQLFFSLIYFIYDTNTFLKKNTNNQWLLVDNAHLKDEGNKLISNFIKEKI